MSALAGALGLLVSSLVTLSVPAEADAAVTTGCVAPVPEPGTVRAGDLRQLFDLNQGLSNFDRALTPRARARSIFVGYNGGHTLPSVLPPGWGRCR